MIINGTRGGSAAATYQCTGVADSTAIASIINNFYTYGTAPTMRLFVVGEMGMEATGDAMLRITSANERGASVHIDFSDCDTSAYPANASVGFMRVEPGAATRLNLYVSGLHVTAESLTTTIRMLYIAYYAHAVHFIDSSFSALKTRVAYLAGTDCSFTRCRFDGAVMMQGSRAQFIGCRVFAETDSVAAYALSVSGEGHSFTGGEIRQSGTGKHAVSLDNPRASRFTGCKITGTLTGSATGGAGVYSEALSLAEAGATFDGCAIGGYSYAIFANSGITTGLVRVLNCTCANVSGSNSIYQATPTSTMRWVVMGCQIAGTGYTNGSNIIGTSGLSNAYVYAPAYSNVTGMMLLPG